MELKGYPIILISRAARPAGGFELFAQQRQRRNIQRQAAHHRHAFATRPLVSRCPRSTPSADIPAATAAARWLAAHWHCATGWLQSGQMRPVSVE